MHLYEVKYEEFDLDEESKEVSETVEYHAAPDFDTVYEETRHTWELRDECELISIRRAVPICQIHHKRVSI